MNTKATVAIKFIKDSKEFESGQREKMILERIHSSLRVNHAHFVKLLDHFQHNSQLSLVYEMLSMDFVDALELRKGKPLCVSKIRPIAKQLFMALSDLKKLGILHTDLKPDNIMLVDQRGLKIKLIDFGLARRTHEARTGTIMQASGLRAPEIMLGLPFSYPLDIWGVGQILLFLYNPQTIHNYSSYQNANETHNRSTGYAPKLHIKCWEVHQQIFCKGGKPFWLFMEIKALQHDFITMGHLRTVESKDYLKMCEKMNSLAFTEVSADNSNEKRNEKNLFESEIRRSSQKEAKTLEKEEKPTKEGDIKSFMGKVFKAECSESSEAETSETSEAEAIMSLKDNSHNL
ncbi:Homeodomain-interacting protein kinase 1 [Takifugu flavidus]|uniref:Homeodomain-interacting protein kinase 1 n=1 Tax=Takifugu flavidus TaxID=433684 RepID=A0A5C6MI04_9TELE|nr:Homeodomain-interacting protein kinase 1 [Takifugu flavidus]